MTRLSDLLENFGAPPAPAQHVGPSVEDLDTLKAASFEDGYKAGWEDASRVQAEDRAQITGEFARNLQDLSFTYHEAHTHLLKSMRPLLNDMVEKVLPRLAQETLVPRIVEEVHALARNGTPRGLEVVVPPDSAPGLTEVLNQNLGVPVSLVEEDGLGAGQVYLRLADEERVIDMEEVLAGITDAVTAFLSETEKEVLHG